MTTFTHEIFKQDERRANARALLSLAVAIFGTVGLVILAATGNDLIGW